MIKSPIILDSTETTVTLQALVHSEWSEQYYQFKATFSTNTADWTPSCCYNMRYVNFIFYCKSILTFTSSTACQHGPDIDWLAVLLRNHINDKKRHKLFRPKGLLHRKAKEKALMGIVDDWKGYLCFLTTSPDRKIPDITTKANPKAKKAKATYAKKSSIASSTSAPANQPAANATSSSSIASSSPNSTIADDIDTETLHIQNKGSEALRQLKETIQYKLLHLNPLKIPQNLRQGSYSMEFCDRYFLSL